MLARGQPLPKKPEFTYDFSKYQRHPHGGGAEVLPVWTTQSICRTKDYSFFARRLSAVYPPPSGRCLGRKRTINDTPAPTPGPRIILV